MRLGSAQEHLPLGLDLPYLDASYRLVRKVQSGAFPSTP